MNAHAPRPAPRRHGPGYWEAVRAAYSAGWTGPDICEQFDLGLSTLRARAAAEGWRRSDQNDDIPDLEEDDDVEDHGPPPDAAAIASEAWAKSWSAVRRGRVHEARAWVRLHRDLRALAGEETTAEDRRIAEERRVAREAAAKLSETRRLVDGHVRGPLAAAIKATAEAAALSPDPSIADEVLELAREQADLDGRGRDSSDCSDSPDLLSTSPAGTKPQTSRLSELLHGASSALLSSPTDLPSPLLEGGRTKRSGIEGAFHRDSSDSRDFKDAPAVRPPYAAPPAPARWKG